MGSQEIGDYARNFAVMVRVQGSDPKGLKMKKHAFHHYNSGKTTISASGMLLPESFKVSPAVKNIEGDNDSRPSEGRRLVVTVASIIEPFLSLQQREKMSQLLQGKPELIPGAQIDILVEGKNLVEYGSKGSERLDNSWISAQILALVDVPASSIVVQSLIQASSGSIDHGWEVGWSLASYSDDPQPFADAMQKQVERQRHILVAEPSNLSSLAMSTARIALLVVPYRIIKALPNMKISPSNKRGDLLLVMGSPFGVLSPMHFFNSVSVGSIANCYPSDSVNSSLLMADVRCLPGMEGSPVFGELAQLIGILTRPLRQKNSYAEIQLVIPWEAIATACSDLLQEEPQNACKEINYNDGNLNAVGRLCLSNSLDSGVPQPSLIEKAMTSICLVTIDDGVWASGVLLNKQGLILTNAHLFEPWRFRRTTANNERTKSNILFTPSNESLSPAYKGVGNQQMSMGLFPTRLMTKDSSIDQKPVGHRFSLNVMTHRNMRVRVDHMKPSIWCDARVVYVSKGPLDVALLQLEFVPDQLHPIVMDFTCPSPGSKAYVIGHGLFGPRCDSLPSVCVGVVAKVVEAKRTLSGQTGQQVNELEQFPAMLETTAAVHPGGSGGAVLNSNGRMIGLVTSNARHGGGTVIPHLNFSIPCAALEPIFKFSKDMQDSSVLEDLDRPDGHLSSVWELVPHSPKPGPPLPTLSKSFPVDIGKDGKGSRFAKFIAERQEGPGKPGPFGKLGRLSTEFVPCKL